MATLKAANVAAKDIMTSNFSVAPRYDYGQTNGQTTQVTGYDASNNVSVTVRKIRHSVIYWIRPYRPALTK